MKHSIIWFALILIASALLLSVANSATQNERNNRAHHEQPQRQSEPAQPQAPLLMPSPAYFAAILGELRAIVREEIANDKQEHIDRNDWDTPAFWVSIVLALVGAAYTVIAYRQLNAIGRQADIAERSLRAEISLGRPDGVLAEIIPPSVGQRLAIKVFFYNRSNCGPRFPYQSRHTLRPGESHWNRFASRTC